MSDERRPLNHREMVALEFIYALESKQEEMDCLEKRMREIGVWRYYRPAMALMIKVTNTLLHSLCDRNLRHMKEIQDRYIVHLSPRPAVGKLSSVIGVCSAQRTSVKRRDARHGTSSCGSLRRMRSA